MKKIAPFILIILMGNLSNKVFAQLYPVGINEKAANATLVVEGKVTARHCFWNTAHTLIYTANTIELYKSFKGQAPTATVEVLTQGGVVGDDAIEVSDLAQLTTGDVGVFFLYPNTINLQSPVSGRLLYDIYASDQGVMRYSIVENKAACPFDAYAGITTLYNKLQSLTGRQYTIINNQFSIDSEIADSHVARIHAGAITSTSPAAVNAGAISDPVNNVLTITGSGFGNLPSGVNAILFKDASRDSVYPSLKVPYNSQYIISWMDNEIKVRVPSGAANGLFGVLFSVGDTAFAPQPLRVNFSVLDVTFMVSGLREPRLINLNTLGGYSLVYSTSTAGGGVNITTSPVYNTFRRALTTWKEISGVNFVETGNTSSQTVNPNDGVNIIMLDNTNTANPPLPAGVLAITYSGFSTCGILFTAQKAGFDVVIRNEGVSVGTTFFENGPCPPPVALPGYIDMETVILHELGHALNLNHVNEPLQLPEIPFNFANYVNPAGLMHYAISNWATRRTPDASAYNGSLYTITPRGLSLGTCLALSEMIPLFGGGTNVPANDNCPIIFPVTPTPTGTVYNIDLVHATSNKAVDPQYTAANCANPVAVTNNVYQAIRTNGAGNLAVTISNYTTTPVEVATTCGVNQGVRLSVYDVNTCPAGQNFPAPIACLTITGNGALPVLSGLQANKNYLLLFDGVRNTKANFTATLAGTALPLKLLSFTGKNINSYTNELFIKIAEAINVKTVVVERSADGINFTVIGQLNAMGNSFNGSYNYTDANAVKGTNYYRIKTTDADGTFEYSSIVALTIAGNIDISFQPNPFNSFINVKAPQNNGKLIVIIADAVSRKIKQTTFNASTQIATQSLAKGTYLVSVYNTDGTLLITKKMLKD